MKKTKVELFWSTLDGNEWLNEKFEINYFNDFDLEDLLKDRVKSYYEGTQDQAQKLLHGWEMDGEEVEMNVDGRIQDKEGENVLFWVLDNFA